MNEERLRRIGVATAALVMTAACSGDAPAFPESIVFDRQTLTTATSWTRDRMSGIVYVPPGHTLPAAALQVGAIVSGDHLTADALHAWVRDQVKRSPTQHFFESNGADESCRIARAGNRTYIALEVCETGVARAVCVEADEAMSDDAVTRCLNDVSGCFTDICDTRWIARREALDLLAADLLTVR